MNNCKKCGTENAEENQFCSKCGNNLKAKNNKNIFSIICLLCLIVGWFSTGIVSVLLLVSAFVLSIMGIKRAKHLKVEIGKRKGITLAIIVLVFCIITLLLIILLQCLQQMIINQDEEIIGQAIKTIQSNCGIGEFKVNDITVYKRDGGFEAFIDYSFTSVTLGKEKENKKILLHHIYNEINTGKPSSTVYNYGSNVYELISKTTYTMQQVKVNKRKIIKYANEEETKMLVIE